MSASRTRLRRLLRWSALAVALVASLALLWLAARVVFYRQTDDRDALARKRAYLERIAQTAGGTADRPNLVLILFDDLGYGDLGAYGSRAIRTPHIDALARAGVLFRHAYSPSAYCSAARAGLLTGRFPVRAGLDHVVQPAWSGNDLLLRLGGRNRRLPAEEITLAEVLSAAGYATGIFGKWHLGDRPPSLPTDLGFDTFFGVLHANDQGRPAIWRDDEIVERHPIDQSALTRRYTDEALRFLEAHRERAFFVYLPHTFPHVPLHAAAERRGRSPGGLYGDVVEELDASVGEIVEALTRLGLADETLLFVTSDNGPWFEGSAGGVRGRKFDVFEGGMRVPFVAWGPGRIPPGRVIDEPITGLDLFPTVLEVAGVAAPHDRLVDGRSLLALLEREAPTTSPAAADDRAGRPIWFHQLGVLRAVRHGRFKYHDAHRVPFGNPMNWIWAPASRRGPWLFDLELDPDESYDVSDRHPAEARRLREMLEEQRRELAANLRGWKTTDPDPDPPPSPPTP